MRPAIRLLVVTMTVAIPLSASAGNNPTAPDWAHQAMSANLPPINPRARAVILDREETITIQPDGHAVIYHREVVKILKASGREFGTAYVWFNKDSKVNFLRMWTVAADGKQYELKDKDIADVGAYNAPILYSDDRAKVAKAMALEPGNVVAYEYEKREPSYLMQQYYDLGNDLPMAHQRVHLELPQGWEYKTDWSGHPPMEPTRVSEHGWQWDFGPTAAMDFEDQPLHPAYGALVARLLLTYYGPGVPRQAGQWHAVGTWYEALTAGRNDTTPEIAAKSQQLTAGKSDFFGKLSSITKFMQDEIRYFGVEMGIGGYQPHLASEIYRNRYGDCKDKVTLLIALLREAGISAHYVIVDTERGFIRPDLPGGRGNHAIAAIDIPDGLEDPRLKSVVTLASGKRLVIFDPTNADVYVGQIPPYLQGSFGILADGKESQLIKLPVLDGNENTTRLSGHFVLDTEGGLKGDISDELDGPDAWEMRYLFQNGNLKEQHEVAEHLLARDLGAFTLEQLSADNAANRDQPLVVHFKVSASGYAKTAGRMLMVRPHVVGDDLPRINATVVRRFPVNFESERLSTEDYTVEVPAGYAVEEVPDPLELETSFASYRSKTEVKGTELHFTREYRLKTIEVPAEDYSRLDKFVREVANNERSPAIFKKPN